MYEIWKLYVENYSSYLVRPNCWQSSVTLTFDPKMYRYFSLAILHLCMKSVPLKLLELLCQIQTVDKVPLWPLPLDPKMYRYLSLTILHLYMKYESCTLKTTQVIGSEPKCWQSTVVTLTFDPKCIGIFLSPSCIYVWYMKAVRWKLLKLSCQNQSVDKVQLWPSPLDPKMYRYLPLAILHLCMKYECCALKTTQSYLVRTKVLT